MGGFWSRLECGGWIVLVCKDANRTVGELQQFISESLGRAIDISSQRVENRQSYLDQLRA